MSEVKMITIDEDSLKAFVGVVVKTTLAAVVDVARIQNSPEQVASQMVGELLSKMQEVGADSGGMN